MKRRRGRKEKEGKKRRKGKKVEERGSADIDKAEVEIWILKRM
jgi:hypothetical protein